MEFSFTVTTIRAEGAKVRVELSENVKNSPNRMQFLIEPKEAKNYSVGQTIILAVK